MDTKTIFVLTLKGEDEVSHKTTLLYGDIKRALSMVDGVSSFAEISKRAAPSLRSILAELVRELVTGGFIQDKNRALFAAKIVVPPKVIAPAASKPDQGGSGELDFTTIMRAPSADILRAEAAKIQAAQKARQEIDTAKLKAEKEAALALHDAENARRAQEHEARLKAVQEAKANELAEQARLRAEEEARAKQAAETNRIREEQEAARLASEKQAREMAEATRLKAAQEAKAKHEAEALRIKTEQEALRAKEQAEKRLREQAEAARVKAEQEAANARREAELAKQKAEAETKAREEAERLAREQAEAARVKAEQEAERVRAELQLARQKAETEAKARAEAEAKLKQEAEAARLQAEQAALKAREETELAKQKAEAETKAREEAERLAKKQAEAARVKAEQEAERVRAELQLARQKAEAEAKARAEAEAKLKQEAETARLQAEQAALKAREEAELAKQKAEAETKAREEAERLAKEQAEAAQKAKKEAEDARLKTEQEAARVREELAAAKLKAEQESQARLEAEAARLAAEQVAAQALVVADQVAQQEREAARQLLEQQAIQAREEEQKRAKQFALAAASTQVRDTPYDTGKPPESAPAIKLDAIDLDALTIASAVEVAPPKVDEIAPDETDHDTSAFQAAEQAPSTENQKASERTLKEQAKQAEAARIAQELEAKKLADTQAKAWAEAEQRAAEAAKSHASQMTRQADQTAEAKKQNDKKSRLARTKRKPLPWSGIATGLFMVALLAVFLVPMLLPTREYAAQLEKSLSEKLQEPVHIGQLSARILPTPRIDLSEIYIGEIKQIKAGQAQLSFGFGALFSDVKRIDRVELQGAELNGSGLLDVPVWLQKLSADAKYPITRIVFNQAKLNGDAVQLSDLEGEVTFNPAGKFSDAALRANSGRFSLDIKATPANKLETTFKLHDSALPLFPRWNFEDLSATGELTRDDFIVDDFDARIAGGALQGKARMGWKTGWSAQGEVTAKSVSLASLSKLLEGDMDGVARFKMQADTLAKLPDTTVLEGNVVAKKGVINGVDIVETARLRSKDNLPGGRTHFDELNSTFSYSNNAYHLKSMKIVNSVLSSTANIDIVKQQLSGRISAHLSIQEGMGTVDLQVGGAISNPSLRAVR